MSHGILSRWQVCALALVLAGCSGETICEQLEPVSAELATKRGLPMSLPPTAHTVQFAAIVEGVFFQTFVKFAIPQEQGNRFAQNFLAAREEPNEAAPVSHGIVEGGIRLGSDYKPDPRLHVPWHSELATLSGTAYYLIRQNGFVFVANTGYTYVVLQD